MKYPHSFPLWRTNGELLPGGAPSRLVLSSVGTKWNDVVVEQHHFPSSELADVMHKQHMIAQCWPLHHLGIQKRGAASSRLQGERRDFLLPHQPFSA
jgi:hypothetical protein